MIGAAAQLVRLPQAGRWSPIGERSPIRVLWTILISYEGSAAPSATDQGGGTATSSARDQRTARLGCARLPRAVGGCGVSPVDEAELI